jgi:hypothetical protein
VQRVSYCITGSTKPLHLADLRMWLDLPVVSSETAPDFPTEATPTWSTGCLIHRRTRLWQWGRRVQMEVVCCPPMRNQRLRL